jgi:hypothetical protein
MPTFILESSYVICDRRSILCRLYQSESRLDVDADACPHPTLPCGKVLRTDASMLVLMWLKASALRHACSCAGLRAAPGSCNKSP